MRRLPLILLVIPVSPLLLALASCGASTSEPPLFVDPNAAVAGTDTVTRYTCPMHPHYIADDPTGGCPICGMDLVPVSATAVSAHSSNAITVAPQMLQTIGVRTATTAITDFSRSLRAFGVVEPNERLENVVASRLEGWIEDLAVRAEGDTVQPGALLYHIYSPDLFAAQKDYLNALATGNESRTSAVRQRLRSLGMQSTAIERLTRTREIAERVPVYAEAGGTVSALTVRAGAYVKPGAAIVRLQAYSGVWVIASIAERDLPLVATGLPVRLMFPSAPDAPDRGTIDYIYPTIDSRTRTARIRIEVDNSAGHLRPGAYADVSLDLGGQARLSVPSEAVLRDSRGAHVIVALGNGRFAGRPIRTGASANGRTEVLTGLSAGEEVVASGQFLLDSEVNLRAGLTNLGGSTTATQAIDPDTPLAELPIDQATLAQIDHLVDMALYFHEALVDGYRIDPSYVAPAIAASTALRDRFAGTRLIPVLSAAEAALADAQRTSDGATLADALASLMDALEPWLLKGAPAHYRMEALGLFQDLASMRLWLQEGSAAPVNPYGAGESRLVQWPDPMAGEASSTEHRNHGAAHAAP